MKLEPEFKKKWIEALRSGKYDQAIGALYDPDEAGYCCLGVAAHICQVPEELMDNSGNFLCSKVFKNHDIPAFLKDEDSETVQEELADMNDRGKSFNEIANWIEENL